jgi:hypothetical protein
MKCIHFLSLCFALPSLQLWASDYIEVEKKNVLYKFVMHDPNFADNCTETVFAN